MTHHSHNQGLIIERLFSASRAKVWKAWTIPDQVKRWWGPKDFTAPFAEIDLRVVFRQARSYVAVGFNEG